MATSAPDRLKPPVGALLESGVKLHAVGLFRRSYLHATLPQSYIGYGVVHLTEAGQWGIVMLGHHVVMEILTMASSDKLSMGFAGEPSRPTSLSRHRDHEVKPVIGPFRSYTEAYTRLVQTLSNVELSDGIELVPLPEEVSCLVGIHLEGSDLTHGREELQELLRFLYAYRDAILALQHGEVAVDFTMSDEDYLKQMFLLAKL